MIIRTINSISYKLISFTKIVYNKTFTNTPWRSFDNSTIRNFLQEDNLYRINLRKYPYIVQLIYFPLTRSSSGRRVKRKKMKTKLGQSWIKRRFNELSKCHLRS